MKLCTCPACVFVADCALTLIALGDLVGALALVESITVIPEDDGYYAPKTTPVAMEAN